MIALLAGMLMASNSWAMNHPSGATHFDRVMVIFFENEGLNQILRQPNFKKIAEGGALFSNFNAEIRPSQGNYIAFVSGSDHGVDTDSNVDLNATHIGDLLESGNHSWKTYLEGFPGNCFTGAIQGNYVRKHNPFISFQNISENTIRCKDHLVNANEFDKDLARNQLPEFILYIPDLKNDGHDTGVSYADQWLGKKIIPLLSQPKFTDGLLLIITFDEGNKFGINQTYTSLWGNSVIPHTFVKESHNHYSLLRLIEDNWALGTLGRQDQSAAQIDNIWK